MSQIIASCCTLCLVAASGCASTPSTHPDDEAGIDQANMDPDMIRLGNFSVSLAVKDLNASREFYEKIGFRVFGGDASGGWLILQNESCTIGLFQGMFEKNILTFNPGWDRSANTLADFDDVRDIQRELAKRGITPVMPVDESTTGPGSFVIVDPDGNPILVDQHVPRPVK